MRRIRLTEGQLHRIIRHAVNEAIDDNSNSYILQGISVSHEIDDDDELNDNSPGRWNETITAESLEGLIRKLCAEYGGVFDMDYLISKDGGKFEYYMYSNEDEGEGNDVYSFYIFKQ